MAMAFQLANAKQRTATSLHQMIAVDALPRPSCDDNRRLAFDGLARRCAACGAPPAANKPFSACQACNLTRYCSVECQRHAYKELGHRASCGLPLPMPATVRSATATDLPSVLQEFGTGHPQAFVACCERISQLRAADSRCQYEDAPLGPLPSMVILGQAGAATAVVRGLMAHPSHARVQLTGCLALFDIGSVITIKDLVSEAGGALAAKEAVHRYLDRSMKIVCAALFALIALSANRCESVGAKADRGIALQVAMCCKQVEDEDIRKVAGDLVRVAQGPYREPDNDDDSEMESHSESSSGCDDSD